MLSDLMESRNVDVDELSRLSGVSVSTIRRMRRDHTSGNLYSWRLVASALGVTVSEIIGEHDAGREG